ncbi:AraC family transcriptional regulator [Paenibacillus taichungensis]|uniref:AraC family transcriptional regulator n=1 Tax=Paenibacillus taichungensis TaxID=484184 RepID=UPI002DB69349|nr:AraC family transcriptional regulator [Paenibacillus taichungensis]MEC0110012.1 AraC family transcriptional regulator [Paenibacillus taichungensis]MEC0199163.1 AraC family transcriptional regulator [Paenibacillus taichungensis]
MNTLARLNEGLSYIEENLMDSVDMKEVARIACCSEYHFTRMFSFLSGITLSEYIRRRRLTLAALELSRNDTKVIDVALKFGYTSPDSFARTFQSMHGVTPSEAKNHGPSLKAFPRMTFQLTIQGGSEMNYRIEDKEAFRIVGISKRVSIVFNGVNPDIAAMYQRLTPELIETIKGLSNVQPLGIISASAHFSEERMEEKGELDHYIGAATTQEAPEGLSQLEVPASMWAVFTSIGPFPGTLQDVWGRIYSEWFPSSDYELSEGPEILWNEHKDTTSLQYRSEIWIPIQKR